MEQKKLGKTSKFILISIVILTLILIISITFIIKVKVKGKQDKDTQTNSEYILIAEKEDEMNGVKIKGKVEIKFKKNKLYEKFIMTFDDSLYCHACELGLKEEGIKPSSIDDNKIVLENIEAEKLALMNSIVPINESDIQEMFEKEYTKQEMEEFLLLNEYSFKRNGYRILTKETENLEYKVENILNSSLINNAANQVHSYRESTSIGSESEEKINESFDTWMEEQDKLIDDMEETKRLLDSIQNSN